jgi:glucose-6-phosphate isomerase, archaeal
VTRALPEPFALLLDLQSGRLDPHTTRIERRASDLRGAFADAAALDRLIGAGDPVLYHVLQYDVPEDTGQLICCTTVLQPGTVGDEYYMTKGHYHAVRETAEIYLGLSGHGMLLLRTAGGQVAAQPMEPGVVAYVPPCWAHRSVNTGEDPLVFLAVYPAQAGHDYGAIGQAGFGQRVLRTAGGPELS